MPSISTCARSLPSVDFRELLTKLFQLYRVRIWMSKIGPPREDRPRPR